MSQKKIKSELDNKDLVKSKKAVEEKEYFLRVLTNSFGLGFSISLPIAGGAILGAYLDKKLHFFPKLTLFFIFLGLILSIYNFIRFTKK